MENAMLNQYPYPQYEGKRSIGIGILLSIITCGFYGLYWQYKQMQIINAWLGSDRFSFWRWFLLSMITCGIYEVYEEYKMGEAINTIQRTNNFLVTSHLPIICLLLTLFGMGLITTAIQQHHINNFYFNERFNL